MIILKFISFLTLVPFIDSSNAHNFKTSRQAIPVALVQGGTLVEHNPINKNKPTPFICNSTYQQCSESLIEQAKTDIKQHKMKTPTDISEALYNASVAGALERNSHTILHNNTIHLIQNKTNNEPSKIAEPAKSSDSLINITLPYTKTINIQPRTNTSQNSITTAPTTIKIDNLNQTNISNRTISLSNTVVSQSNNKTLQKNNVLLNETSIQRVINVTLKRARKRTMLKLHPHTTNVYLKWFSGYLRSLQEENNATKENDGTKENSHSIFSGPLGDMPQNPHGNGPQDKNTKDLKVGTAFTVPDANKSVKHKKKLRPKRYIYNFDVLGTHKAPYASVLDNNAEEESPEYEDITRSLINAPTKTPKELASLYKYATQENDVSPWETSQEPPRAYDIPEQWVPNQHVYDKFIENEAASIDGSQSKLGAALELQSSLKHLPIVPSGTALETMDARDQLPVPSVENGLIDKRVLQNPLVMELLKRNDADTEQQYPSYNFDLEKLKAQLSNKKDIFPSPLASSYTSKDDKDYRIQKLLNRYDEETKQINDLYRLMLERLSERQQTDTRSRKSHWDQEEQLTDPESDMTPNNVYPNEAPFYRDPVRNYKRERERAEFEEEENERQLERERNEALEYEKRDALLKREEYKRTHEYEDSPRAYEQHENYPVSSHSNYQDNVMERDEEPSHTDYQNDAMEREENLSRANYQDKAIDIPSHRSYEGNAIERDEVPEEANPPRSRLVEEFLKMFANQNRIPNNDEININYPLNSRGFIRSGYQQNLPMYPQINTNPFPVQNEPSAAVFPPMFGIQKNQNTNPAIGNIMNSFMSQYNNPTPQQAAVMTNMGTAPDSLTFNPATIQGGPLSNNIAGQQGLVMLMVQTPTETGINSDVKEKKEKVDHQELTHDGITRASSNITDDDRDFSVNLKKAAEFVLNEAVKEGNISLVQRTEIERKLNHLLDKQYKNKTRGEIRAQTRAEIPRIDGPCEDKRTDCEQFKSGGVCPFMRTFMKGACSKTCQGCPKDDLEGVTAAKLYDFILKKGAKASQLPAAEILEEVKGLTKSSTSTDPTRKVLKKSDFQVAKVPRDPVMHLSFENTTKSGTVIDMSGNDNNAVMQKGASVSERILGTCGKAAELNDGSIAWSGDDFKRKPDNAISIAMWVKVKKSGVINWFANGKKGDKTFYTKTKGTAVPAKVWTHVAGTFDSQSGLARIYINGDIEQEQQQERGAKLAKNWLVNGIGTDFGDDSLHYVDEVVLYDRALSSSEIRSLYNRCMFNRMILHFGFQKGNNTNMNDQSGLENNGILIGGAEQKSNCDRCGACLDLTDGPDPTMKIQQISVKNLPRVKLSIAVWVSFNSTRGIHNIFTTESSNGNIGYRLQVVNGRIRWAIGTDTIPVLFDNMTKSEVVPEALWTHIIVTYNNENGLVRIYANGLKKFQDIVAEDKREYLPTNWENDASIGDRTFRGYIDEFIMYNWELDESEALYVRNYCADHPKLVRFTVRVPLTKKTMVPRGNPSEASTLRNWWDSYLKMEHQKKIRDKKAGIVLKKINPANSFTLLKHRR